MQSKIVLIFTFLLLVVTSTVPNLAQSEVVMYEAMTLADSDEELAKIGIDKSMAENLFKKWAKDEFRPTLSNRFFIAKIASDKYLFIMDSWQFCGTVGCEGKIVKLTNEKLTFADRARGRFFCDKNKSRATCYYYSQSYNFYRLDSKKLAHIGLKSPVQIEGLGTKDLSSCYITQSSFGDYLLLHYATDCRTEEKPCNVDNLERIGSGSRFKTNKFANYPKICYMPKIDTANTLPDTLYCMSLDRYQERLDWGKDFGTSDDDPTLWRK